MTTLQLQLPGDDRGGTNCQDERSKREAQPATPTQIGLPLRVRDDHRHQGQHRQRQDSDDVLFSLKAGVADFQERDEGQSNE